MNNSPSIRPGHVVAALCIAGLAIVSMPFWFVPVADAVHQRSLSVGDPVAITGVMAELEGRPITGVIDSIEGESVTVASGVDSYTVSAEFVREL